VAPTIHFDAILGKRDGHPWRGVGRPGIGITPKTTGSIKTLFGDSQLANCDKQITPACLKALYGIPELYKPQVPERNRFGIGALMLRCADRMLMQGHCALYSRIYASGVPPV
jgi:tripeptidyl-peptidase-1